MPVAIQLALQFKETTFLTKDDFKSDSAKGTSSTDVSGNAINPQSRR
jgi:hypothetical protein